ncbi:hypothetical protein [Streptomyces sp. SID6139]|uniref:hypothetical protein n=1 Tax=Streptomyces sp. SID6139 TaxID=2690320 RepID=UPI00136C6D9B|nr:hypothetical protein [Streptomyces sp. SID6139]
MPKPLSLPFDPIARADELWQQRWGNVPSMAAITSIMRAQQILLAEVDAVVKPYGLTFARYEALVLLTFSKAGELPMSKIGERLMVHPTSVTNTVERLDGNTVVFTDGRSEPVDTIVWATGYRVHIPFLDPRWVGEDPERLPLYQRVFHLEDPSLGFVGLMQSTGAALPVVEAQAKLAAACFSGGYALPSPEEQRRTVDRTLRAATARWGDRRPHMRIDFDQYLADIPREIAAGRARLRRGARPFTVPAREGSPA